MLQHPPRTPLDTREWCRPFNSTSMHQVCWQRRLDTLSVCRQKALQRQRSPFCRLSDVQGREREGGGENSILCQQSPKRQRQGSLAIIRRKQTFQQIRREQSISFRCLLQIFQTFGNHYQNKEDKTKDWGQVCCLLRVHHTIHEFGFRD